MGKKAGQAVWLYNPRERYEYGEDGFLDEEAVKRLVYMARDNGFEIKGFLPAVMRTTEFIQAQFRPGWGDVDWIDPVVVANYGPDWVHMLHFNYYGDLKDYLIYRLAKEGLEPMMNDTLARQTKMNVPYQRLSFRIMPVHHRNRQTAL